MGITRQDELKDIKTRLKNLVPNSEIIACHEANIQIKIVYVQFFLDLFFILCIVL